MYPDPEDYLEAEELRETGLQGRVMDDEPETEYPFVPADEDDQLPF